MIFSFIGKVSGGSRLRIFRRERKGDFCEVKSNENDSDGVNNNNSCFYLSILFCVGYCFEYFILFYLLFVFYK